MTTGWVRITDLTNPQQVDWFDGSKPVYEQLFPLAVAEPHRNFANYIRDTESRRQHGPRPLEPEEFYYVAVVDDEVWGMMCYTAYPERHHGFVAYMGILDERAQSRLSPPKRRYLGEEMIKQMVSDFRTADCTSFLFELEPIEPEHLALRKSRGQISDDKRAVINRIRVTDLFQRKGARKIGWIRYRQPMLEWNNYEQEGAMHLVYVPVSQLTPRRESLTKSDVRRFVEFVYLTFYYDGFRQTEQGRSGATTRLKRWRRYLRDLCKNCLNGTPESVPLQRIELSKVTPPVFISYPQCDLTFAQLASEYLKSLGIPVRFWEQDRRDHSGEPLWETIKDWIDECDTWVFILTQATFHSRGQQEEINYVRQSKLNLGRIIPVPSSDVSHKQVEQWFGTSLVAQDFHERPFHDAIADVGKQLQAG